MLASKTFGSIRISSYFDRQSRKDELVCSDQAFEFQFLQASTEHPCGKTKS